MWAMKVAYYRAFQKVMKIFMMFLDWSEPQLLTGPGAIKKLPGVIKDKGINNVMIVTDKGLMSLHLLDGLFKQLEEDGISYTVYDGVQPNPSIENIEEARAQFVANGCQAMIAFGGGSPMDCAKAACARVVRPNKTIPQMRGQLKVMHKLPPFFAVPTTAGTGSETTLAAVVSNTKTHEKYAINDPCLRPKFAVLDPELTVGLPPHITSTTGMDALTHAVEAYVSTGATPLTDACAEKAIKLVSENLRRAVANGSDIHAREGMCYAQYLAGMAFNNASLGHVHAMAHQLGGFYNLPHGECNAILLPIVEEYNLLAHLDKFINIARMMDENIDGLSKRDAAELAISAIRRLSQDVGIPASITELAKRYGKEVSRSDIPTMVANAQKDACGLTNPRKMTDAAVQQLYEIAF